MLRITQLPLLRSKPISLHTAAALVWTRSLGPAGTQLPIILCALRPCLAAISASAPLSFSPATTAPLGNRGGEGVGRHAGAGVARKGEGVGGWLYCPPVSYALCILRVSVHDCLLRVLPVAELAPSHPGTTCQ